MSNDEERKVLTRTEVKVYFLPNEELERLATWFDVKVQRPQIDSGHRWVTFKIPHTEVEVIYHN